MHSIIQFACIKAYLCCSPAGAAVLLQWDRVTEGLHSEEKFGPTDLEKLQMRDVMLISVKLLQIDRLLTTGNRRWPKF